MISKKIAPFGLIVMFIIWSIIASQSPFYIDDWNWAYGGSGISYGGRFIGNFFSVILNATHNQIIVGIFKSFILTLICFFVCMLTGKVKLSRIIVFNVLFLLMNMKIVYESFLWTSGFVNYLLPFVFVLPVVIINIKLKNDNNNKNNNLQLKAISLICIFASTFFLENLSITMIIYLFTELILNLFSKKKEILYGLIAFLTSIISFMIMILNSERFSNNNSGYSVSIFHNLGELLDNAYQVHLKIVSLFFHENVFFWILFFVILTAFLAIVLPKYDFEKNKWYYILLALQGVVIVLCPTYQFIVLNINLINPRVLFPSFMILIIIAMLCFGKIEDNFDNAKIINVSLVALLIISMIFPTLFFVDMAGWNRRINQANQNAITSKSDINYSGIRPQYAQYYYCTANGPLIGSSWSTSYKDYYGIPQDVVIK
ncbi:MULTISPECIES: DUF6056 family protein [unclassified Enterococcus]|uniref:DUF6056 family protein n=1 Tax=unclassified Enterococcus TaxID=2608891 RepID=UPI001556ACC3|nr:MULTISPECIES: DUF6056 family protein [unclassified Enterococcus]MBS7577285.1 hypothetical protein [Enterococcus sp. MMGLQ5-2]MBS7584622.1 hypothetical protein [Enterococcus sp. MMGLQ5-1]NPD12477.1 hypothetical protein [Enterococcus sp. MMGLQ5-1]NPD37119.1 hypothetical protein [Enterococcus sp. MMGLQ5-2]